jgi:RNA polymerase sigma-70 factor, ECF subfamily
MTMSSATLAELEALYRAAYPRLVRVATAITRDHDAAAEAVQEAFARAICGRSSFRGDGTLEAWVWRGVVNESKRAVARPRVVLEDPLHEASSNGAASGDAAVRALIVALPERQRLAIFLRYYADLDYRTIGEILEVEVGTVSATLHAAHQALREGVEGVTS